MAAIRKPAYRQAKAGRGTRERYDLSNTHQIKLPATESLFIGVHRRFISSCEPNFRHSIKYPSNKIESFSMPRMAHTVSSFERLPRHRV